MISKSDLINYFVQGIKRPDEREVGVEWEKIGVYKESGEAIRYFGPRGVEAIFKALIKHYGWRPVKINGRIIALKKKNASITLEPGGQIELSGQKAFCLDENFFELRAHLAQIRSVSDEKGIVWLGTGLTPVSGARDIEWTPKPRYAIMRRALTGPQAHRMMKETASIQISLDYTSERDAIEKLRLGSILAPVFIALFANSPFSGGRLGGYLSERAAIWQNTDAARTGVAPGLFQKNFNFENYADFALRLPLMFILRGSHWISIPGLTFAEYLRHGYRGHRAHLSDWKLHLSTLFTEARLKQYVEIRSVDCQKTMLGFSAAALAKGIFYDAGASSAAQKLFGALSENEWARLYREAPRKGLRARFGRATLLEPTRRLVQWAEEGLKRQVRRDSAGADEYLYLLPLKNLLEEGKCPAEKLIDQLYVARRRRNRVGAFLDYAAIT